MYRACYRIVKKLGAGGQGVVYLAFDKRSKSYVCIKKVAKPAIEEKRGIELSKRLTHHGFVKTIDVFEDEHYLYHCMEYIEGIDLSLLKKKVSVKKTKSIALQLLEMIADLRNNHLTFNDIKPDNIILSKDGQVHLIDMGAILEVGDVTSKRLGSYYFSAPEYLGKRAVNEKADLYSLGKTLQYVKRRKTIFLDLWLNKVSKRNEMQRFSSLEQAYQSLKYDKWITTILIVMSTMFFVLKPLMHEQLYHWEMKERHYLHALMIDLHKPDVYQVLSNDELTEEILLYLKLVRIGQILNLENKTLLLKSLVEKNSYLSWEIQKEIYILHNNDRYELMENFSIDYINKHINIEDVSFFCRYMFYLEEKNHYLEVYHILKKRNHPDTYVWMIELAYRLNNTVLLEECYQFCSDKASQALVLYRLFLLGNYQDGLLHQAEKLLQESQNTELYQKIHSALQEWGDQA